MGGGAVPYFGLIDMCGSMEKVNAVFVFHTWQWKYVLLPCFVCKHGKNSRQEIKRPSHPIVSLTNVV